jgi:UDP-glucuronate decarboxylase
VSSASIIILPETRRNIESMLDHHGFEVIRHDVTFPLYLEADQIYNLACPASPIHYQHDPVQTTKTSVHGAINMLGLAKRLRAKILQASTSEIYGDPNVHPQGEEYWGHVNPIGPRACYDEGKRCAETLFFDYWRQHKLAIKVARIFNTYGPRMHPKRWPGCVKFYRPGAAGPRHHGIRRWPADPLILLR